MNRRDHRLHVPSAPRPEWKVSTMVYPTRSRRRHIGLDREPGRHGRSLVLGPQLRQVLSIFRELGHLVALLVEQAAEPGFLLIVRMLQAGSDTCDDTFGPLDVPSGIGLLYPELHAPPYVGELELPKSVELDDR